MVEGVEVGLVSCTTDVEVGVAQISILAVTLRGIS